jgi:hypothetical protein
VQHATCLIRDHGERLHAEVDPGSAWAAASRGTALVVELRGDAGDRDHPPAALEPERRRVDMEPAAGEQVRELPGVLVDPELTELREPDGPRPGRAHR